MRKQSTITTRKKKIGVNQMAEEEIKASSHHPADTNGDGKVSPEEHDMFLEFKRKRT